MAFGIPSLKGGITIAANRIMSSVTGISSLSKTARTYAICSQDDDSVIVEWDSCIFFEYHNESSISDAPQEQGAFISYNKVASPFTIHTRATKMDAGKRSAFLELCEKTLDSLTLYKFVTPDRVYSDVNLTSIDYRRGADAGYSLLAVDFVLREVRINKESRYEKTKEPSGEKQKSSGQVATI